MNKEYTKEMLDADMKAAFKEMRMESEKQDIINNEAIEFVKLNIQYSFEMIDFSDLEFWQHEGFVELEKSDYKSCFYPTYDFYTEKGSKAYHYMKQDVDGEFHNMVWQITGHCEDDYSGYILYPLSNGKYWKISYSC